MGNLLSPRITATAPSRRGMLGAVVGLLSMGRARAQDQEPVLTGGLLNGHGWRLLDRVTQDMYLTGMSDALSTYADEVLHEALNTGCIGPVPSVTGTTGESVNRLNRYYNDTMTLNTSVVGALKDMGTLVWKTRK